MRCGTPQPKYETKAHHPHNGWRLNLNMKPNKNSRFVSIGAVAVVALMLFIYEYFGNDAYLAFCGTGFLLFVGFIIRWIVNNDG